jgi:guanylate kinase
MSKKNTALLLIVSAPSGAGKSTLCNHLIEKFTGMTYSVSCTTRAPRGDEKEGEHYFFLSRDDFMRRVEAGDFLEYAEVHGNFYGTLKQTIDDALSEGRDVILDIDVQGAQQIREACALLDEHDPVRRGFVDVFIAPPSMDELRRRLCGRGTDAPEVIEKRLLNAEKEMAGRDAYQHLIVNDDLKTARQELIAFVESEHKKRK